MYIPQAFRVEDRTELIHFMNSNSFGILFSQQENEPLASHLPFLFVEEADGDFLIGHMAKANPQWSAIGQKVLVVFQGEHAYISPTWYQEPNTVPTWNYTAVHAYGTFELIEDEAQLVNILEAQVQFYESGMPTPWPMPERGSFVDGMLKAIVGFRIKIERLEGKWKLNQNHTLSRQQRVADALLTQDDAGARAIGERMARNVEQKSGQPE